MRVTSVGAAVATCVVIAVLVAVSRLLSNKVNEHTATAIRVNAAMRSKGLSSAAVPVTVAGSSGWSSSDATPGISRVGGVDDKQTPSPGLTPATDGSEDAALQTYLDVGRDASDRLLRAVQAAASVSPDLFARGKAPSGSQVLLLTFPNTGTTMTQMLGHCIVPGSFCTSYEAEAVPDSHESEHSTWLFHQRDVRGSVLSFGHLLCSCACLCAQNCVFNFFLRLSSALPPLFCSTVCALPHSSSLDALFCLHTLLWPHHKWAFV
jgi:hypothetical protein